MSRTKKHVKSFTEYDEAIVWYKIDGKTTREIAAALGCEPSVIERFLQSRGLKPLEVLSAKKTAELKDLINKDYDGMLYLQELANKIKNTSRIVVVNTIIANKIEFDGVYPDGEYEDMERYKKEAQDVITDQTRNRTVAPLQDTDATRAARDKEKASRKPRTKATESKQTRTETTVDDNGEKTESEEEEEEEDEDEELTAEEKKEAEERSKQWDEPLREQNFLTMRNIYTEYVLDGKSFDDLTTKHFHLDKPYIIKQLDIAGLIEPTKALTQVEIDTLIDNLHKKVPLQSTLDSMNYTPSMYTQVRLAIESSRIPFDPYYTKERIWQDLVTISTKAAQWIQKEKARRAQLNANTDEQPQPNQNEQVLDPEAKFVWLDKNYDGQEEDLEVLRKIAISFKLDGKTDVHVLATEYNMQDYEPYIQENLDLMGLVTEELNDTQKKFVDNSMNKKMALANMLLVLNIGGKQGMATALRDYVNSLASTSNAYYVRDTTWMSMKAASKKVKQWITEEVDRRNRGTSSSSMHAKKNKSSASSSSSSSNVMQAAGGAASGSNKDVQPKKKRKSTHSASSSSSSSSSESMFAMPVAVEMKHITQLQLCSTYLNRLKTLMRCEWPAEWQQNEKMTAVCYDVLRQLWRASTHINQISSEFISDELATKKLMQTIESDLRIAVKLIWAGLKHIPQELKLKPFYETFKIKVQSTCASIDGLQIFEANMRALEPIFN